MCLSPKHNKENKAQNTYKPYWSSVHHRIITLGKTSEKVAPGITHPKVSLEHFSTMNSVTASQLVQPWSQTLSQDDRIYLVIHIDEVAGLPPTTTGYTTHRTIVGGNANQAESAL